ERQGGGHGGVQPQHPPRGERPPRREFRSRGLGARGVLRPRELVDRDAAPRLVAAAGDGAGGQRRDVVPTGRGDPHRDQLQVHEEDPRAPSRRQRPRARALDDRRRAALRARLPAPGVGRVTSAVLASEGVRERLEAAWDLSDEIFATLREEALGERPVRLRQPVVFYVGHLPAFAWNHLGRRRLGKPTFNAAFDELFARGIDPPDTSDGPSEAGAWPAVAEVRGYRDRIRRALRPVLDDEHLEETALMVL